MNIDFIDGMIMPIITAACLCIGFVMKKWMPTDDKWIPTVLLVIGAISGLILFGVDYEGIVKGMVSGLAAVGLHQVFKQHMKIETEQTTFNSDSFLEMLDAELTESEVEDEDQNRVSEEE
jgi:hypothetical protein